MVIGHANKSVVEAMCADDKYKMTVSEEPLDGKFDTCNGANKTKRWSTRKLLCDNGNITIHTGICGPVEISTIGRKKYFATFTIANSRYCEAALLSTRDQVGEVPDEFIA